MVKRTDDTEDWLPTLEASQLLARRVGGLTRARHLLAIGLRESVLSAAAEASSICEGEAAEFIEETAATDELLGLPSEVWRRSANWDADRLRWDWDSGEFEIEDFDSTYMFHGVHLMRREVEALDPDQPPYAHVPVHADDNKPSLSRRGPKPSIRWASLIEALLHLERDGELVTGKFDGPGELLRRIQDIVPEGRQFDDRSIEPIVAYVHEHLLCGPPPRN